MNPNAIIFLIIITCIGYLIDFVTSGVGLTGAVMALLIGTIISVLAEHLQ